MGISNEANNARLPCPFPYFKRLCNTLRSNNKSRQGVTFSLDFSQWHEVMIQSIRSTVKAAYRSRLLARHR